MVVVGWLVGWWVAVAVVVVVVGVGWVVRRANGWYHEMKLDVGIRQNLPPGDLGWPLIGTMWSFLSAFKSSSPETFIQTCFLDRFGPTGIYKTHMFGNPSIIATTAETCRRILTDDDSFKPGWPASTVNLIGRKSFTSISDEDHRWLRRLTAASINGHEALSVYLEYIEKNVITALDEWSSMGEIEFLTQLRKLTFNIIMHIFLSTESEGVRGALERQYTRLNFGVRAMAINIPGFAYYSAFQARKRLVAILQGVLTKRREEMNKRRVNANKDMMDGLMDAEDENGRRLSDEEIIDILIMYLNAGHESSAHTTMWATLFLLKHPDMYKRAKAEQEEIVKNRLPGQKSLNLREIRHMDYLSKVIDETLRIITISLTVFREPKKNVRINGYTIPKGWKVLVWFRGVHFDPETYEDPKKFDPSRWDGFTPKAGQFLPFGAGSHLCPGNDLAKIEIAVFLHHFLLNYKLARRNPDSPVIYLPHTRPKDNCLGTVKKITNGQDG
ncbi:ent-kaurenoic acid oxidase 1-like [Andrographis paniculata]|uniref:ent-kaurenoic acid oxidase 1-like n=1 Tax=Andrographis paniculata TaxID=175694 RepID=UPI0021E8DBF5|nr:ent-kaurenoic acid oxidase 1-like [Andrographis paniculata]